MYIYIYIYISVVSPDTGIVASAGPTAGTMITTTIIIITFITHAINIEYEYNCKHQVSY